MLSVVILTKNEEKNIIDCLETVLWADEIIIVDDFSEDRTGEIVKNLNNKKIFIHQHHLNENFAEQRNFGLAKTTKKWVLFVDADERVSSDLHEEINSIIINQIKTDIGGFFLKRKDVIWNKMINHGEAGNTELLRLAKRDSGIWIGKVHEVWQTAEEKTACLENILLHYPHQTLGEFIKEINNYSTIRAKELYQNQIKAKARDILFYPLGKFIVNYFLKLGFLDGIVGIIYAIMMSFHSFLVRAKLWLYYHQSN